MAGRVPGYAKAGEQVDETAPLEVEAPPPYVSRAGHKLANALDAFGVDPAGLDCLDVGASTGGFTDVLLQRGAARVIALDVGYGQLHGKLRADPGSDRSMWAFADFKYISLNTAFFEVLFYLLRRKKFIVCTRKYSDALASINNFTYRRCAIVANGVHSELV